VGVASSRHCGAAVRWYARWVGGRRRANQGRNTKARAQRDLVLGSARFAEARVLTDIIFNLLFFAVGAFKWAIIASAVISTLLSLNVLDSRNRFVWSIADFLFKVTDPALRPIRAVLPSFNGIDLSPWVALVLLQFVVTPLLTALYVGLRTGVWQPLF
jgi:YggT family protein